MKNLFLFIMLLLPMAASADQSGTCGDNVTWTYNETTRTLTISGSGEMANYASDSSPWYRIRQEILSVLIEEGVTSIGNSAFNGCSGLTSVTIPNSVTSIGDEAFRGCSGLTSVTIPNSVTSIGNYAFENCSGLTSITIPNSVTSIGFDAFSGCSGLTSVHISDLEAWCKIYFNDGSNPLYYAHHLFLNGEEIKDLVIPNSVTRIGDCAFSGCSGLTSVTIPNSVTSIGGEAFSGCSGLTSVTIPNSVTSIGNHAFENCSGLSSITIPNSVTSIGFAAFYGCSGLTSVHISDLEAWCKIYFSYDNPLYYAHHLFLNGEEINNLVIPNSVTSIGNYAFVGCSGLTSVTIPNSVTSIGERAFSWCSGLTSVTIPNSVTSIGNYAFSNCSGLTSVTIPNSVTSIGEGAFSWCSGLTSVTFHCKEIGSWFQNMPSIKRVTIGDEVMAIGNSAFYRCSGLTSVTIPNSVTSIGSSAFSDCSGLTSVSIGNSVTSIGDWAFSGCSNLMTVISKITEPFNCNNAFSSETQRKGTLYVPAGTKELYARFDGWREFLKIVEEQDGAEQIYLTLKSGSEGRMKQAVKRGEAYTFVIEPEDGWAIHSVTFNGNDVTSQLDSENRYTTPAINDNATLCVTYEQWGNSIRSDANMNVRVSTLLNSIQISNATPGSICRIFSTGGEMLESFVVSNSSLNIPMPSGHVYIVKIGERVFKVGL